jgi:TonB family protein
MTSENKFSWMDRAAVICIHQAARCAPGPLSERLTEEWLADMGERPSAASRLRFALGCFWAISIIAREHRVAAISAVTASGAQADFTDYIQMGPSYSPRRTATFVLVASLHAAVLGGLMLGITQIKRHAPPDFKSWVIDKPRPQPPAPTMPKPDIQKTWFNTPPSDPTRVVFEKPEITVDPHESSLPTYPDTTTSQDPPPHPVNRVHGAPGAHFPSTSDYYPDTAIRRGEQGSVAVNACVNTQGRLTSDPTLLHSSGSATLDQAALRLAKAGSGRYQPSTEDGRPVDSCYGFLVQFILK